MTQTEKDKKLFALFERFVVAHEDLSTATYRISKYFEGVSSDQDVRYLSDALKECAQDISEALKGLKK